MKLRSYHHHALWTCLLLCGTVASQMLLPQDYNFTQDYCRRFGHQNPYFQYHNLSTVISESVPQTVTDLTKPPNVPNLTGGALWADEANEKLYLYGGRFSSGQPLPFELWMYDAIYSNWTVINSSANTDGFTPTRVYDGASTVVEDLGIAFYFGGWIGKESEYGWDGEQVAVGNLLQYNMVENVWMNQSGPETGVGRVEGALVYVPTSDNGMLVAFGGMKVDDGNPANATGVAMSDINVYDIASGKWYYQTATGQVPESRRLFCAGVASDKARNIHNIYLYGGASTPSSPFYNADGYDDTYILTIPTFEWTKYWPDTDINSNPHNSLTCNVIDNRQMLIIGGWFPRDTVIKDCDAQKSYGVHNLDLSGENNTLWKPYTPELGDYEIPTTVAAKLNGPTPTSVYYNHPDLSTYLTRTPTATPRAATRSLPTPTSSPSPSGGLSQSVKIIIGVVAGVVSISIIGAVIFCVSKTIRKRQNKVDPDPAPLIGDHPATPGEGSAYQLAEQKAPPHKPSISGYAPSQIDNPHHAVDPPELAHTSPSPLPPPVSPPIGFQPLVLTNNQTGESYTIYGAGVAPAAGNRYPYGSPPLGMPAGYNPQYGYGQQESVAATTMIQAGSAGDRRTYPELP
ncbi:hypothetical protein ABW19_dt0208848 [Dactylella cylindrospora]|nr:hypothetical protein ABW19_dt0208848 [Dactylella cylindrospora]